MVHRTQGGEEDPAAPPPVGQSLGTELLPTPCPLRALQEEARALKRAERCSKYKLPLWAKRSIAWFLMVAIYVVLSMLIVIYGRLFGPAKTQAMLSSWGLALSQTFVVEEPGIIALSVILPWLMNALTSNPLVADISNAIAGSFIGQAFGRIAAVFR